jgi:hypothetical protein
MFNVLGGSVFDLYNINRVGGMLGVIYASCWAVKQCLGVGMTREVEKDDGNRDISELMALDRTIRCVPSLSSRGLFERPLFVVSLHLGIGSFFSSSPGERSLLLVFPEAVLSFSSSSDDHAMTGNCIESCCCCMDIAAWNSFVMSNFRLELESVAVARGRISLLQPIIAECSRASVAGRRW